MADIIGALPSQSFVRIDANFLCQDIDTTKLSMGRYNSVWPLFEFSNGYQLLNGISNLRREML